MPSQFNIKNYILHCLISKGNMSLRQLAAKIPTTPQNLNNIMNKNNLKVSTLESIAKALDAKLEIKFIDNETGEPIAF